MTRDEVRERLDELGIEYPHSGKGSSLRSLRKLLPKNKAAKRVATTVIDILETVVSPTPIRTAVEKLGCWIAEPFDKHEGEAAPTDAEMVVDALCDAGTKPHWPPLGNGAWRWVANAPPWARKAKGGKYVKPRRKR